MEKSVFKTGDRWTWGSGTEMPKTYLGSVIEEKRLIIKVKTLVVKQGEISAHFVSGYGVTPSDDQMEKIRGIIGTLFMGKVCRDRGRVSIYSNGFNDYDRTYVAERILCFFGVGGNTAQFLS